MFFPINHFIQFIVASIIQFYIGAEFYKSSFSALKNRLADMNLLVAIGTSAAYLYSTFVLFFPKFFPEEARHLYFEATAFIITFILIGRYLENKTKKKASDILKHLLSLKPEKAIILVDGKEIEINAENIVKGDIVILKAGDKIPADGIIIEGNFEIDQSMLTGESMPVFKTIGDKVIGGTVVISGNGKIKATQTGKDTVLSSIINTILQASSKKPSIGKLADKIVAYFVPSVLIIAIIVFDIWYILDKPINFILTATVSVLIIACPCALGLATPIAIVRSISISAKNGILIKNPDVIEIINKINIFAFDKTGTLTKGKMKVIDKLIKEKDILDYIYSVESRVNHPISYAIKEYLQNRKFIEPKDIKIFAGKGIIGIFEEKTIYIGNINFMKENNLVIKNEFEQFYKNFINTNSVIFCADKEIKAAFVIADQLKEEAKEVIHFLKEKNIKVLLLTGDNRYIAEKIAKDLKIDEFYAEITPLEKLNIIEKLQKENNKVAFVGDGINDAPSIVKADIGIAVASATDLAKESGDIIILNNNLKGLIKFIKIGEKTLKIIKQNLFWAYIYNIIGIPIAAGLLYPITGHLLNPIIAGIAMSLSSITVVSNTLRIK